MEKHIDNKAVKMRKKKNICNMNTIRLNYLLLVLIASAFSGIFTEACTFHGNGDSETELESTKFIRIREDIRVGDEVLNLRAYPRTSIHIKGAGDSASDKKYFKIKEVNNTNIQVLLDKSINDLVDRDVPQNVLKFKIECTSKNGRYEESSFLTINVYVEDVNDHAPKFRNLPYQVYVDESTSVGTSIFSDISAHDRDKPNTPNSDVQYSIQAPENEIGSPYFALESPHRPHVVLRRQLDFDEGKRIFEIPIVATDRGENPRSATTTLMVMVKDSDDLPPKFTEIIYRTKINEFSPKADRAIKVPLSFSPSIMAYDQDSLNTTLIYDIISGNDRNLFWINPSNGVIYLMREIDLEEETLPGNTFVLQIEARQKDSPIKRAIARIEIEILDLNDNRPEFEVEFYNISIVENLPSGFSVLQVIAIDRDQNENADFLYIISEETPNGAFLIDPRTGWITVRDQELLDREVRTKISITIQAIEKVEVYGDRNQRPSTVHIEITLLDANDNTPQFDMGNLYEFKINQNAPVGHVVGYITATDPDEGRNGMLLYELKQPKSSGSIPFRLDSKTGALSVSNTLKKGRVAIFVEASDQPANPSERRFSLAVVTVEIVTKVTDGSLDFIGAPYEFWVGANAPIGYSVGHIKTNLDFDTQGEVMYDLLHSYSDGVPFAVEERSGVVTVIRNLDEFDRVLYEFEAVAAHFMPERGRGHNQLLKRTAKAGRQITKTGDVYELEQGVVTENDGNILITNVTVHVVNPDEEKGILMRGSNINPIEFHVRENMADALIGQLIYKNVTREEYRSISTNAALPTSPSKQEQRQGRLLNAQFNKTATKIKQKTGVTKRRNRNIDIDQFYVPVAPSVFYDDLTAIESQRVYVPIRRKFIPTKPANYSSTRNLYRVKAANRTRPAETPTTFTENTTLYPMTGETIMDNLLNGKIATVPGSNTTGTSKVILVTPRPIRKQSPEKQKHTKASLSAISNATRADKQIKGHFDPETRRGLRFLIANQHDVTDMITITNDGTLMTLKALDREERDTYHLTIIAEYFQGYVTGAGIYQIVIYVDDVNDNPPVFNLHTYSGSISENADVNTEVKLDQQILVHDADIGENAEFDLMLQGEGSIFFTIDKLNMTKRTIEQFTSLYSIGNQRFARAMSKIETQRKNISDNSNFMNNNFLDVPRYVIRYTGPNVIDREIQSYYEFTIVAKDKGGLSSEAKLTLYVKDMNDNPPIFDKIAIFKDAGIEIIEYSNDIDVYFVDPSEPDALTYPIRNHVRNSDNLLASASNVNYEIMLLAEGSHIGTPRQMTADAAQHTNRTAKSNRNRARRRNNEKPFPVFSILENVEVGSTVLKLMATDDDYENNAIVNYKILSETYTAPRAPSSKRTHSSKFFGIDGTTGELRVFRALPAQAEILLNISATDTGGLNDITAIKFKVIDMNDHAPVFEKIWYTFDISEGEYKHMVLGKILATDEDYSDNANITYALTGNDIHPFYVVPLTGIIKINGELDRETKSFYEMKIIANDNSKKEKRLSSTAEIEISVLDVNDNAPLFTGFDEILTLSSGSNSRINNADDIMESISDDELPYSLPVYKAYLNRNTEPGTYVKQITAIDKDFLGNGNGLVMYALRHNSLPYLFEIDSRDGVITTIAQFHRYNGYEHINLTVIASDLGIPSKSSVALLIVNLQGDNLYDEEYEPASSNSIFQHKYYEIEVPENNVVPTMLLQINASSSYQERSFKWSILSESGNSREFRIDPNNGTLWVVRSLDRESDDLYKLKVRADPAYREGRHVAAITYPIADERVGGLAENEVRIVIRVKDENDNAPRFVGNGKPIVAVIPNKANFGYPVTKVEAIDDDIGLNAEIRFTLLNEPYKLFEIDEMSGNIRVLGPIVGDQRVYGFDVKATDRKGAEDGKSNIVNVFVYILDDNRQVRLVLAGAPIDIEKEVKTLANSLSDVTGLDIRIRMIEPHLGDNYQPATDVYLYAVDPRTNAIVDMDVLRSTMNSISMNNLTTSARIIGLAELGDYQTGNAKIPHTNYNGSAIRTSELATIILAFVVFAGGLTTAFCVVCVRYKRRANKVSNGALAYAITGVSSNMSRPLDELSSESNSQIIPHTTSSTTAVIQRTKDRRSERGRREYIDVPLPQSVLSSNFNLMEHENRCVKYNPLQHPNHGCDSGVGLTAQLNDASSKHILHLMRDSQRRNGCGDLINNKRGERCVCGFGAAGPHICSGAEDSSDSYEDSLKNVSCLRISRRTSFPKAPGLRRSQRSQQMPNMRGRHSFSDFK